MLRHTCLKTALIILTAALTTTLLLNPALLLTDGNFLPDGIKPLNSNPELQIANPGANKAKAEELSTDWQRSAGNPGGESLV